MRLAALALLALAFLCLTVWPARGLAQSPDEYQRPAHIGADDIAVQFLSGRYITPLTCKLADGTQLAVEDSVVVKSAPEAGGGTSAKVTFYGLQVSGAEYCYSSVERRAPDRRGVLHLHFRTRNRPEYGIADFRRAAKAGPLTYHAHRGELLVREVGPDAAAKPPLSLLFGGGESRLVVEGVPGGTDGAKLVAQYFERHPEVDPKGLRVFTFRFYPADGPEFTFYAIEDRRRRR